MKDKAPFIMIRFDDHMVTFAWADHDSVCMVRMRKRQAIFMGDQHIVAM